MMPVFRENAKPFANVHAIRIALLKLSMAGYRVLKFSAAREPLIEIDKPFEGEESTPVNHGGRSFESCVMCGCRVYWQVTAEISE